MAVPQHRDLTHGLPAPENWFDALERFLAAGPDSYAIKLFNDTTVLLQAKVPVSGANTRIAAIPIRGKWRFLELDLADNWQITRAHPAGAAGTYFLFAVASANEFAAGSPEIDNTYYGFELRITNGVAPAGNLANGKAIAHYQVLRSLEWDGAKITALKPFVSESGVYRTGPLAIKTDDSLEVAGALTVGGQVVARQGDLDAHVADATDVHGLADTARVIVRNGAVVVAGPGAANRYVDVTIGGTVYRLPLVATD